MTTLQSIPLNRLVHSKANVRRTGRGVGLEGLMASIAAHGLRQNLNVRQTSGNRYEVVAGGRRLEALRRLAASGKVDPKVDVACLVLADDEDPTEVSLTENVIRTDMHPDDQFEAFRALVDGGLPVEDVGARFGVTPAVVRQRLKLASVSPQLREQFRKGELSLAQVMALTLVDDHTRQEQALADLPEWNRGPEAIRRVLTAEGIRADSRLGRFVGVDAYEAAGGAVLRSLFDEEEPVLADGALVERLATERLESTAASVRAEGWEWVEVALEPSYGAPGRIYPVMGDDGERRFRDEERELAGARVCIGYDGNITVDRGLLDAAAVKAQRAAERAAETESETGGVDGSPALPDSVMADLTAHRTAALRLELARHPHVALASVVHALGLRLLYRALGSPSCVSVSLTSERLDSLIRTPAEGSASQALVDVVEAWRQALPGEEDGFWDWCLAADDAQLVELLAVLAGYAVNAVSRNAASRGPTHADQLAAAVDLDMAAHWTPLVEGFFGRLTKAQLAAQLTDAGKPEAAAFVAGAKKAEGAAHAQEALAGSGWLPEPLRP